MDSARTLLCIGDSNTYGYDPRSFLGSRYPKEIRWTDRLQGWKVINCGVNGMTVPKDFPALDSLIQREEPEWIILMLGSNDLLEGRNAEEITDRMAAFIDSLKRAERKILLISPPRLQPGEWVQSETEIEESRRLAEQFRELSAREGVCFADAGEWGVEVTFDGVHFSPSGHEVFAQRLAEQLQEIL